LTKLQSKIRWLLFMAHGAPWRSQLIFVCNFVKNQRILMWFAVLDFKMNDTYEGMNITHIT